MMEKERLNKIRELLLQQKKVTWTEILEKTCLASADLSYDLLALIRNGEIRTEGKTLSNLADCEYILIDRNRTLAEAKRHETIQFIENIKKPLFNEAQTSEDRHKMFISVFAESQTLDNQKELEFLQQMLDDAMKNLSLTFSIKEIERYRINKLALVFAFERKMR